MTTASYQHDSKPLNALDHHEPVKILLVVDYTQCTTTDNKLMSSWQGREAEQGSEGSPVVFNPFSARPLYTLCATLKMGFMLKKSYVIGFIT